MSEAELTGLEAESQEQSVPAIFELPLQVVAEDIDANNHANNIVYLRWVQEVATAHWDAAATESQKADYAWVVLRHEIDYVRPALLADELTARTWVGKATGARFERHVEIRRAKDDLLLAQARSVWAAIDAHTGRPRRIDAQLRLSFYAHCLLCLISLLCCSSGRTFAQQPSVRSKHGMVASANGIASQVGVDILKRGGNAVDAACAVGLALAVTYPAAGNLGGGGFMLIRLADGRAVAIDYRETAPAAAQRTLYLDKAGNVIPNASLVGYRAAGVPGTVAGLGLAQQKYGVLKWRDVVEPARRLAAQGFPVSPALAAGLRSAKDLARFPASRRVFLRDGQYYAEGELFKQPELAATLQRLAEQGPHEFYTGRTAQLIAEDMRSNDGLITLADLQQYRANERTPLRGSYRGYEINTMPPPSSGGAALLEMLNILEPHDIAAIGYNSSQTDHLLIEAMRRAFADRAEFMGDPDFVKVPVEGLISKRYAAEVAATIDPQHATPSAQIGHGQPLAYESPQTTHFSVVDGAGNAVSNTYTLNMGFGSCATVRGAGFLLNDEMDDFTSKPGVPNGFGLIQGEANAIAPRKRPLSSMTPTILTRDGKLFLVIGSPGGPTIINTVLQVILNVVDHGMDLARAIAAPRLHHQWLPDIVRAEPFALPEDVLTKLRSMGHTIPAPRGAHGERWGDAEGILIDPATGTRLGASDPRSSDAAAIGY